MERDVEGRSMLLLTLRCDRERFEDSYELEASAHFARDLRVVGGRPYKQLDMEQ